MKKLILVAAVLTVVVFAFGAMAAQQKASPPPAQPAQAIQTWNVAAGVIEKIDAAAKTLEIKTMVKVKGKKAMEAKMTNIAADDKTKFFTITEKNKEKKLAFADLKTGMNVTVNYKVEAGKNIATFVKVVGQ